MEQRSGQRNILDYLGNMDLLGRWLQDKSYLIELNTNDIIEIRGFALEGDSKIRTYKGEEALQILKNIAQEEYVYECRINADNEKRKAEAKEIGDKE